MRVSRGSTGRMGTVALFEPRCEWGGGSRFVSALLSVCTPVAPPGGLFCPSRLALALLLHLFCSVAPSCLSRSCLARTAQRYSRVWCVRFCFVCSHPLSFHNFISLMRSLCSLPLCGSRLTGKHCLSSRARVVGCKQSHAELWTT
jgi:hypothetical protein